MNNGSSRWDPVPHLAALIDGVRQLLDGEDKYATDIYARIEALAVGPYAALRGGLLLDEPGRERVSAEAALREVLAGDDDYWAGRFCGDDPR